jgi:hypothetical protein
MTSAPIITKIRIAIGNPTPTPIPTFAACDKPAGAVIVTTDACEVLFDVGDGEGEDGEGEVIVCPAEIALNREESVLW